MTTTVTKFDPAERGEEAVGRATSVSLPDLLQFAKMNPQSNLDFFVTSSGAVYLKVDAYPEAVSWFVKRGRRIGFPASEIVGTAIGDAHCEWQRDGAKDFAEPAETASPAKRGEDD